MELFREIAQLSGSERIYLSKAIDFSVYSSQQSQQKASIIIQFWMKSQSWDGWEYSEIEWYVYCYLI